MEAKYEVPLPEDLTDEMIAFWDSIFGEGPPDLVREMFLGAEEEYSHGTLYLARQEGELAGTCFTLLSKTVPGLAGFAQVATAPHFRGRGISTRLCGWAVEDFRARGGKAFFLGTGSPEAARIYYRLGWRKLAGTNVMANIASGDSPEGFLVDYFRAPGTVKVAPAGPDVRVPMIPLMVTPHDGQVLDANIGLYSCRYCVQHSCMGLYPKYGRGLDETGGAWFAARTEDGRVVGLSSALLDGAGGCQVDAFAHRYFPEAWNELVQAACQWGRAQGASVLRALVSVEDEEKQALFEALGFGADKAGEEFDIAGRPVSSRRMRKEAGPVG